MVFNEQTTAQVVEKLVDWKNPPKLTDLKQDLLDAKPAHDSFKTRLQKWRNNLNIEGAAKVKSVNNGSAIVPKLIRKQAEWRYPALSDPFLSTSNVFKVGPVSWEDKKSAEQNALVLNNQFNTKINKQSFVDEYVRAVVDEGTAIIKIGWIFEEEEYEDTVPVVEYRANPNVAPLHQQLAQMKEQSPSEYETNVPEELKTAHEMTMEQGVPVEPVVLGHEKKKLTRILKNHPSLEVCEADNVIIDPSCKGDLD